MYQKKTVLMRNIVWWVTTTHNRGGIIDRLQWWPTFFVFKKLKQCVYRGNSILIKPRSDRSWHSERQRRFYNDNQHFTFIVKFVYIGTLHWLCVYLISLIFISQKSNPCVYHQNLLCKTMTGLIRWNQLVNRWLYHWHLRQRRWRNKHTTK